MSIIHGIIGSIQGGGGNYLAASFGARPGWGNPSTTNGTYNTQGTPYDPGGNVSSVPGSVVPAALRRVAYDGTWINNGNYDTIDNPTVFNGTNQEILNDPYISFDNDSTRDNYCLEWKGYWQAPSSNYYNFSCYADDVAYVWLGNAALSPDINNYLCKGTETLNTNSVSVVGGQWYPIRIWFQEWSGAETLNVFSGMAGTTMTSLSQNTSLLAYNGASDGY